MRLLMPNPSRQTRLRPKFQSLRRQAIQLSQARQHWLQLAVPEVSSMARRGCQALIRRASGCAARRFRQVHEFPLDSTAHQKAIPAPKAGKKRLDAACGEDLRAQLGFPVPFALAGLPRMAPRPPKLQSDRRWSSRLVTKAFSSRP